MAAPRTETLTIFNMLPKRFFPPKALPVAVAPAPRGRRRRFAKLSSFVIVIAENRSVSEACDSTPRQCRRHHVIMMSSSIDASVIVLHPIPPRGGAGISGDFEYISRTFGNFLSLCSRGRPFGERPAAGTRSEEHTSELQSLMRISYAVFCLKNKKTSIPTTQTTPS